MGTKGTVLTTGANSGIGLAAVIEVARRGYRSLGSVRSEAKADRVRAAADEAGVEVETVLLDVTDAEGCERVVREQGPLYGLVNNAGYGGIGAVEDVAEDEARLMVETMLLAPGRLARLAVPGMREAGEGRIVNVSSIYGVATTALTGWYQACKHGLEGLSDALRTEVVGAGIKVVLVEPGGIRTAIWEDLDDDTERRADSRFSSAYRRSQQITRFSQPIMREPEAVGKVIADALEARSPRARYLVGYDAQALALADRLTITSVKDRIVRLVMGL